MAFIKKYSQWVVPCAFAVLGAVFITVYGCTNPSPVWTTYVEIVLGIAAPFLVPVWGLITKKPLPLIFSVVAGLLVLFGVYLGKAVSMYSYIPHYDKFLHTNFGLMGAALVYGFFLRWKGGKTAPAGMLVLVILATLGLGGLWEIFEYVCSYVTGEDPQCWHGAVIAGIESGQNPLTDTMLDLIVTVIGSCIFAAAWLIDRAFGGKAAKKLYGDQGVCAVENDAEK